MSSNITDRQFTDSEVILPEPHFDEEATLLSARPVVPLEQVASVKSTTSLPRPWILGLGLAGALLVGIFATVIYYSRANADDATLNQETEVSAGVEGKSNEATNVFSGPAAPQPKVASDEPREVKKQEPLKEQPARAPSDAGKKPRPRLVAVIRENKSNNHGDDEESKEDRKAARKRARQERRRAEREQRERRSSDELLRIRDIFEGSPRP